MEIGTQLVQAEDNAHIGAQVPYREIIGSLMYAGMATRPDIVFAVSVLSQFVHNPAKPHWEATKRIVRYLKGTKDLELTYGVMGTRIVGYTDADHASQYHWHSISRYMFLINRGAVSWSSKRQPVMALSTAEAEYMATAHLVKEILWLQTFLGEITRLLSMPMTLNCDNQSAITLTKDGQFHARTKHIDLRFHFICEAVADGTITMAYFPTQAMVADILMKPLIRRKMEEHTGLLGLLPPQGGSVRCSRPCGVPHGVCGHGILLIPSLFSR